MASSRTTSADISKSTLDDMKGYPGSKGGSGHAERIIRQMPPHTVYIEGFAGAAAVFRKKLRSASSILIDVDAKCCHRLRSYIARRGDCARVEVLHGDALGILPAHSAVQASDTLANFDPPYLESTRSNKVLYDYDSKTLDFHTAFLDMATALPCMVMISGYRSELYAKRLKRWRMVEIPCMTHGGPRIDCLWCNFPEPEILHDPRWAGADYRQRELIKRRKKRWAAKFAAMDPRVRQVVAIALVEVDRATVAAAMRMPAAPPFSPIAATDVETGGARSKEP